MDNISILTLNVEGYRRFYMQSQGGNLSNLSILDSIINECDPDILLLQEDIIPDKENEYPSGWVRVSVCESHKAHSVYDKDGNLKKICNSVLVRPQNLFKVTSQSQLNLDIRSDDNTYITHERCGAIASFKNIIITSVHLSGGRFEDRQFNYFINLRDKQVSQLIGADIIAGDFNSNLYEEKVPTSHPVYVKLKTPIERQAFAKYFTSGHKPLLDADYLPVLVTQPTDVYGNTPDAVYYNPKKLLLITSYVVDCLKYRTHLNYPLLTDHNGIYCKFKCI